MESYTVMNWFISGLFMLYGYGLSYSYLLPGFFLFLGGFLASPVLYRIIKMGPSRKRLALKIFLCYLCFNLAGATTPMKKKEKKERLIEIIEKTKVKDKNHLFD